MSTIKLKSYKIFFGTANAVLLLCSKKCCLHCGLLSKIANFCRLKTTPIDISGGISSDFMVYSKTYLQNTTELRKKAIKRRTINVDLYRKIEYYNNKES